jgi:hypothetical protein
VKAAITARPESGVSMRIFPNRRPRHRRCGQPRSQKVARYSSTGPLRFVMAVDGVLDDGTTDAASILRCRGRLWQSGRAPGEAEMSEIGKGAHRKYISRQGLVRSGGTVECDSAATEGVLQECQDAAADTRCPRSEFLSRLARSLTVNNDTATRNVVAIRASPVPPEGLRRLTCAAV